MVQAVEFGPVSTRDFPVLLENTGKTLEVRREMRISMAKTREPESNFGNFPCFTEQGKLRRKQGNSCAVSGNVTFNPVASCCTGYLNPV